MTTRTESPEPLPAKEGISSRNALSAMAIRGGSLASTVLVPVVATRVLDPDQVGVALVWLSAATILAVVAPLGLPWSISTGVAALRSQSGPPTQLRSLLRAVSLYLPLLLCVLLVGSFGVSYVWPEVPVGVLVASCAIGVFRAGSRVFSEVGKAFGHVSSSAVTSDLLGPLVGLAAIAIAAFVGLTFTSGRLLAFLAVGWAVALLAAVAISPIRPSLQKAGRGVGRAEGIGLLAAVAVLNVGVQQVHIVLAGLMLGSLEAAQFSTAARLATLTGAPLMIIAGIASPDVGLALKERSSDGIRRVEERLQQLTGLLFVCAAVLAAAYLLGGPWILRLAFGTEYEAAHVELVLLSVGPLASLFAGIAGLSLTLAEKRELLLRRTVIGSGLAVSAMVSGGVIWGSIGLAAGYSVGQVAINLLLVTACRSSIGLDPSARPVVGLRLLSPRAPWKVRT